MTRDQIEKLKKSNTSHHYSDCACLDCHYNKAISAVLSLLPEDCVMAPIEPTIEMIKAAFGAQLKIGGKRVSPGTNISIPIYRAMISAHQKEVG